MAGLPWHLPIGLRGRRSPLSFPRLLSQAIRRAADAIHPVTRDTASDRDRKRCAESSVDEREILRRRLAVLPSLQDVGDLLALVQAAQPCALDGGNMDEHVLDRKRGVWGKGVSGGVDIW